MRYKKFRNGSYEVPRKYFDYAQVKWLQKREKFLKLADWSRNREDDKSVPPVKTNFVDDVVKLAKFLNDQNTNFLSEFAISFFVFFLIFIIFNSVIFY